MFDITKLLYEFLLVNSFINVIYAMFINNELGYICAIHKVHI